MEIYVKSPPLSGIYDLMHMPGPLLIKLVPPVLIKLGPPVLITFLFNLVILVALCKQHHDSPTFFTSLYANLVALCMLCAYLTRLTMLHMLYFGGCSDVSLACLLRQLFLLTLERVAPPLAIAMLLVERGIYLRCSSKEYLEQHTKWRKALMLVLPWLVALGAAIGVTYRLLSLAKVTRPWVKVNSTEGVDWDCLLEVEKSGGATGVVVFFWTSILLFCFIFPGVYFAYSVYTNYVKELKEDEERQAGLLEGENRAGIQEGHQLSSNGSESDTDPDLEGKTYASLAVTAGLTLLSGVVTAVGFACTLRYGWLDEPTQCAHFVLEMASVLAALAFPETRQTRSFRNCACSCTCARGSLRDGCESECSFTGSEGSFRRTETAPVLSLEEQGLILSSPIEPTRPRASGS